MTKCRKNLYCTKFGYHFFGDCSLMVSEAKEKVVKGKGLKILTPKQMLQRLPIAFAKVKMKMHLKSY